MATGPMTLTVATDANLGKYIADGNGRALYLYTKDTPNTSNCYDKCATAWPPLITQGNATAAAGLDQSLISTTSRTDGSTQVTFNGWPLYYFAKDQKPGDILGQGVGGVWYLVSPDGKEIEGGASSSGSSGSSSGSSGSNTTY